MVVKVGINGFGRIGRLAFRRIQNVEGVEVTRINDLTDPNMLAHLLKYDTTQGRFDGTVEVKEGGFEVNGNFIKVSAERDQKTSTGQLTVLKSFLKQLVSLLKKKLLKNTYMLTVLKKLLSQLLVETTLKQLFSTLTTTFLTVLKQLSQVLHVLQTV